MGSSPTRRISSPGEPAEPFGRLRRTDSANDGEEKPPASLAADVPSATDPRGLGTFALIGLALAVAGALILRGRALPAALGYLALAAAALLVFIYVGRLVILNPRDTALHTAAVLSGFLVNPICFAWLGAALLRQRLGAA